jgi:hypothetical protein
MIQHDTEKKNIFFCFKLVYFVVLFTEIFLLLFIKDVFLKMLKSDDCLLAGTGA